MKKYWIAIICLFILGVLDYKGFIWHNYLFATSYKVEGVDVSHHQGKIDWNQVKKQTDIRYAYIKATEGNDFVDKLFLVNWANARKAGLYTGAYHYFSMGSSPEQQAKNFIKTVPKEKKSLPPVIDVEISLHYNKQQVRNALQSLISILEKNYQKKPILYVTYNTYHSYIKGYFPNSRIWIRDIYFYPDIGDKDWFIWQFNSRGMVDGIPTYVDINVLNGSDQTLRGMDYE